jgi:hypothetical protein
MAIDYRAMAEQLQIVPQAVVDAIEDLNNWVCLHPKFATTLEAVMNAVRGRSRDLLIVVIGPARVGKSTLFDSIAGIADELARQAGKRRGCFRFSVPPADRQGRFNWTAAITEAYALSDEILPFNKIEYGDITEGAPRRNLTNTSGAAAEAALWRSFVKNSRLESLFTIVDEGNTIPVTLSELQVVRAIHAFKYFIDQTRQPFVIGGTSTIKKIVEHDTQLKVRTKILRLDAYGEGEKDMNGFRSFIEEMENRLGPRFCEPSSLSSHAAEIRKGVDGRPGLVVRVATDALSKPGIQRRLDWKLYKMQLDAFQNYAEEDLAMERLVTRKAIVAAAEAATSQKPSRPERGARNSRVGATRNTNAPNHPFA